MRSLFIPGIIHSIVLLLFLFSASALASTSASAQYDTPYCGDNFCDPGESGWCSDCDTVGSYCGDGFCDPGESGWCSDCGVQPYCGDGFCDAGESGWCSDCGVQPYCGDGFCDAGETYLSCANDCGCSEQLLNNYRCSGSDRQREKVKPDCTNEWVKLETCAYGCNVATATCNPKKCEPKYLDTYKCNGSQREILELQSDCTTQKYVPIGEPCVYGCREDAAPISSNLGRKIAFCVSPPIIIACVPDRSCSSLGCGAFDSCGNFCGSCPTLAVVDNLPTATINVLSSAAPASQLSILVTGTDDNDVAQLLLYDSSNNQIDSFDCTSIQTSCSKTFTRTAPATFSTAYTFKARSKDSASQLSGFVSGSGITTAAPVIPPVVPPLTPPVTPPAVEVAEMPKPLQVVTVKFPLQPLFMRALNFPDTDCVRPGESALLAVKVQNTAKAALKDISFAATVPELGVRVSKGPIKLKANGKLTQLLRLDIPDDAEKGEYYLRFTITNNKFKRTLYRTFAVDSSC